MENTKEYFLDLYSNSENFYEFYNENKETIYLKIIETFTGLKDTDEVKLFVNCELKNGVKWVTEYIYTKENKDTLLTDIKPYFIKTENYEICQKIKEIYENI